MQIDQLRYLVAALEFKNFSDAAQVLYVTPQTVSKSIRALEKEFGVTLFERKGNNVAPTKHANALFTEARRALEAIDAFQTLIKDEGSENIQSHIVIAVASSFVAGRLPIVDKLNRLASEHSEIQFSIIEHTNEGCTSLLLANQADFAVFIGELHQSEIATSHIGEIKIDLAVSSKNPLSQKGTIELCDLTSTELALPVNTKAVIEKFTYLNTKAKREMPHFVPMPTTVQERDKLLENGGGILIANSTSPKEIADCAVTVHIASNAGLSIPMFLAWRKGKNPELANQLLALLRD